MKHMRIYIKNLIFAVVVISGMSLFGQTSSTNLNTPVNSVTTNNGSNLTVPQYTGSTGTTTTPNGQTQQTNTYNNSNQGKSNSVGTIAMPTIATPNIPTPSVGNGSSTTNNSGGVNGVTTTNGAFTPGASGTQGANGYGLGGLLPGGGQIPNGAQQQQQVNPNLLVKYTEYQSYCRNELVHVEKQDEYKTEEIENLKNNFTKEKSLIALNELIKASYALKINRDVRSWLVGIRPALNKKFEVYFDAYIQYLEKKYLNSSQLLEKNDANFLEESEYYFLLAQNYFKLDSLFDAKVALQKAQKKSNKKELYKIVNFICKIDSLDSNLYESIESCNVAIAESPENPLNYIYLGISYREKQNFNEAYKMFKKANEIKKNEFALVCLGELFAIKKAYKKAQSYFDEASAVDEKSGRAYYASALIYFDQNMYSEALSKYEKACSLDKTYLNSFREAYQKLNSENIKIAHDYFQKMQSCSTRY